MPESVAKYNRAAKPLKRSAIGCASRLFNSFIDHVKIFVLSLKAWSEILRDLFKPQVPKNIAGQLALVTGGGNGLGREIALRLAKEGCNIIIFDVDEEAAEKTASDSRQFNVNSKGFKVDVTDLDSIKIAAREIEADFGPVDILVNNAGVMPTFSFEDASVKDIEFVIKVNITSHLLTVRVFLESMMRRRKGHIIAINSLCGYEALYNVLYTTTKFAARGFMECMSEYMRERGLGDEVVMTTVYPTILNTRKEYMYYISTQGLTRTNVPMEPEAAADSIVKGVLKNKDTIFLPWSFGLLFTFLKCIPEKIKHIIKDSYLGR